MEDIKDTIIYWPEVRIIVHAGDGMKESLVDIDELKWHEHGYRQDNLTLQEIGEQLLKMGYQSPFYVWKDTPLEGRIYLYGNYNPPIWEEHGTTRGYA